MNNMVKPQDHSSDTERVEPPRKHGRSSSSDQPQGQTNYSKAVIQSVNHNIQPTSPTRPKTSNGDRLQGKRRKSSTLSSKHKTRPGYSRRYSTPPSRPLSPAGFPQLLEPDMVIPELDLNKANHYILCVDTAPQEPDIWSDPETDYFSTIEGPAGKHNRAKSRRQVSQSLDSILNQPGGTGFGNAKGLQKISEDAEHDFTLQIPGSFAG